MKIVAIIPSRYASTRLAAKALANIAGKPMVQHVYERTFLSKMVTDVIVATDDARIERAVKAFGGKAVMTSSAIQSGSDRIAVVAKSLDADIIVNVQGDEPLIDPELIDQTIQGLIDDSGAMVGTAVKRIDDPADIQNPSVVKVALSIRNRALYFSRSPIPFVRDAAQVKEWLNKAALYKHIGIYVYRKMFLEMFTSFGVSPLEETEKLEQLRVLENGFGITCVVTDYDSIAVDTQQDLDKVRLLITQNS